MTKEELIINIVEKEWDMFKVLKNVGKRAECQNNKPEFIIMRKGQWNNLPIKILESYNQDLDDAIINNRNLLFEKYVRMMKYSSPIEYEDLKHTLFELSLGMKTLIRQIEKIYLNWAKEFEEKYPKISKLCRPVTKEFDTKDRTSLQTYLIGELSSYSLKTLVFYLDYVKECKENNLNLVYLTNKDVISQKGFDDLDKLEELL